MIDHIHDTTNMNVLGKLGTNEFGFRLTRQTRRFSCMNPLQVNTRNGHIFVTDSPKLSKRRLSASSAQVQKSTGDENKHQQQQQQQQQQQHLNLKPKQRYLASQRSLAIAVAEAEAEAEACQPKQPRLKSLPKMVRAYIEQRALLTKCQDVHICDGSEMERQWLIKRMASQNMIKPLKRHQNCWLARTDPRDVARVESKTFICTRNKHDVIPRGTDEAQKGILGNWMDLDELDAKMATLLAGCMAGRTMYVIPFSMGPIGSKLSKVGIQLTDSAYVVASMHIMTRVSRRVLKLIEQGEEFVKCFHSVGCPLPLTRPLVNNWPCNPEQTIISHIPERKEIISYGSGYGGNSLLGKKCFALRLGSILGRQEGWLAEHMLIMGVTDPKGTKKYVAAAFPSACGKTNLAMMTPSLPGYKIECVGDDIAWMRFDDRGVLRAINPEAGFFGVAPGTNEASNPNAMKTIERNTIFTNVAETEDGHYYWEGLEKTLDESTKVIDWQGAQWDRTTATTRAAHPNSRFCAPASQCPIIDPLWESAEGVPISAIIFGGRRPEGVPLVYESFDWNHGVFVGASMRSETTAAAEHKGKSIMHDPFAMRPFFGYNFGLYLDHWLSFGRQQKRANQPHKCPLQLPKIFHVNWFRKNQETGEFLWPGFGENSRVLDWICRRIDDHGQSTTTTTALETPIGLVPTKEAFNLEGLSDEVDLDELFSISRDFWLQEQQVIENYLRTNVGKDLPSELVEEIHKLKQRLMEHKTTTTTS